MNVDDSAPFITALRPDIDVQEAEYMRLLGFPAGHVMEGRARQLADWARAWYEENGRPWISARPVSSVQSAGGNILIDGTEFTSRQLSEQIAESHAHGAFVVAVSAGPECEARARQAWAEEKPDEYFFLEVFGSAVVERLITALGGRICDWAEQNGMAVLPHHSPGYSGWDVSEQGRLWRVIRDRNGGQFPGELQVLESGMLQPKKSLLAVFGVTRRVDQVRNLRNLVPCEQCSLLPCQYRRAPYQHALPQIEPAPRPPAIATPEIPGVNIIPLPVLNHNAQYSVNPRALRKWSAERLELKFRPDGSVDAFFRYEGTTCSNMGRLLEFHYRLRLGAADAGYVLLDMDCAPAPGDTGHQAMCEYIANPAGLMARIAAEKPLLGRPLNEALSWQRAYSPSGCHCDADQRAHKWGLAFEVIHFALVQREKELFANGQSAQILE